MTGNEKYKINRIIDLLKFIIKLDDQELIKLSIESIIDSLKNDF
jgi:hypothetical protein